MKAKKLKQDGAPRLVNHRWQLVSLHDLVEQGLPEWPEGQHPDFSSSDGHARLKAAFMRFGRNLLSSLSIELEKAAGRGISDALSLIQDPDYYETVKRRRVRDRERQAEWRARDEKNSRLREADLQRRERCELTEVERLQELGHVAYTIQYHEKELKALRERKDKLDRCIPIQEKPALTIDEDDTDDGDDFWPDRITFD